MFLQEWFQRKETQTGAGEFHGPMLAEDIQVNEGDASDGIIKGYTRENPVMQSEQPISDGCYGKERIY